MQCGRTFVGSATGITVHLPIKTDVGWLWVFEFDPFRWENRGGFTYTDQRPFEVLPPEQKKKKKKKKAGLRRERGGSSEPPEPPLRTGLQFIIIATCNHVVDAVRQVWKKSPQLMIRGREIGLYRQLRPRKSWATQTQFGIF